MQLRLKIKLIFGWPFIRAKIFKFAKIIFSPFKIHKNLGSQSKRSEGNPIDEAIQ